MGVCVARMVASCPEKLLFFSGNKVARLLPQCCAAAEVAKRTCKGRYSLKLLPRLLNP